MKLNYSYPVARKARTYSEARKAGKASRRVENTPKPALAAGEMRAKFSYYSFLHLLPYINSFLKIDRIFPKNHFAKNKFLYAKIIEVSAC